MKNTRYLVGGLVATVICAFAVLGTGQQTRPPETRSLVQQGIPAKGPYENTSSLTVQQTRMRRLLDANPTIVPWLLEQAATGDEELRPSAFDALSLLGPIATSELIEGLNHQNPAIRRTAMYLLPQAAESPSFPLNEAIAVLLKVAQDENEDEAFRKQVRMTIYRVIGASQGVTIRLPEGRPG